MAGEDKDRRHEWKGKNCKGKDRLEIKARGGGHTVKGKNDRRGNKEPHGGKKEIKHQTAEEDMRTKEKESE